MQKHKKCKENKCIKCEHRWKQRGKKKPKTCPSCNNPNWNKINDKELVGLIVGDFWQFYFITKNPLRKNILGFNI